MLTAPVCCATKTALVQIRQAAAGDLPAVQSCARAAYKQYLHRMDREPAPMVADFASLIDSQHVYVAVHDDVVVGYVVFFVNGDSMLLDNVAVSPKFIGKGIGKQLVSFVESSASSQNLSRVELYTNEAMTENQAIYPKLGYTETAREQQDGFSRVFYNKVLSGGE